MMSTYVLITPVRDEERTIGETIGSVVRQTLLPEEWVIVSDGSTDGTNAIIEEAAARHPWIRLVALPPRKGRDFGAVVRNTELGRESLRTQDYEFLGLLDADVTFQEDYFERLIERFRSRTRLGLAGGVVIDIGRPRDRFPRNRHDVPGAVQFFRRECFEDLGGLIAVPEGGWDGLTCAMARMHGWETRLFTDLVVDHHKPRNVSQGGPLKRKWQLGRRDHALGYHPAFELAKCASRVLEPPVVAGSLAWLAGFATATVRRRPRVVPHEVVRHIRREQLDRLALRRSRPARGKRGATTPAIESR